MLPIFSPRALILATACLWTGVGLALLIRGLEAGGLGLTGWACSIWIGLVLVAGLTKARLILDPMARKNVDRLQSLPAGAHLWTMLPVRTWLLAGAMIVFGRIVAGLPVHPMVPALFDSLIGLALLASSRLHWQAWALGRQGHWKQ
ncbi:MAG: hypothetical protein EOM25_09580 [Deltaproteobacteria bacterium]|nr:hypothetical protein [Deltaproteobacteria bacterium]